MKVTAYEVAQLAGVSRTTVSLVLNENTSVSISEPTRKRVIEAAKKLSYGPFSAKHLSPRAPEYVAVMLPTLGNPFYPEALNSVNGILRQFGYKTLLCCSDKSAERERTFLESLNADSTKLILYTYTPQSRQALRRVAQQIPVCVLGELNFPLNCFHAALDSVNAGYIVAKHLWDCGHRTFCFVSNGLRKISTSRQKRLEGVLAFLKEQQAEKNLFITTDEQEQDEFQTGFQQTLQALRMHPHITAVIGVNDITAIGAIHAIRNLGLSIPEQVAVVGFDNSMLAQHSIPQLSSVDHHLYDRARLAISTILDDKRKLHSRKVIYEPTLILRESSCTTPAEM